MARTKLLNVEEACRALGGISRSMLYVLIADGELEIVKIRDRTFVRPEDIDALIQRNVTQQTATAA